MDFRALGPLEVSSGRRPITLSARMERLLVAALVARANSVVTVNTLVDTLWGDRAPRTAAKTLQTYVSQVRRALASGTDSNAADRITTRPPGYVLHVAEGESDVMRFEMLLRTGGTARRDGHVHAAMKALRDALDLWRGPAYEEFADRPALAAEATRLEELRLVALEDLVDVRLAIGEHREVVSELEALVGLHPLRERLWSHLMLALYRCERQADALAALQRARHLLVEQLGIDPGPELRRLEQRILDHDPALALTTEAAVGAVGAWPQPSIPNTRYAKNGDIHIAYQVVGDGPGDLIFFADWFSHIEAMWEHPNPTRLLRRLASTHRLILFDPAGMGLSDPVAHNDTPSIDRWMDDALAVLDQVGSSRVSVLGTSAGSVPAMLLAATHPDRVEAMALLNPILSFAETLPGRIGDSVVDRIVANWGIRPGLGAVGPSFERDPTLLAFFGRYQRLSASPGRVASVFRMLKEVDITGLAPAVRCPVLLARRADNQIIGADLVTRMLDLFPNATAVELSGGDHAWFAGDLDEFANSLEKFLEGPVDATPSDRVLATVLVARVVDEHSADAFERFQPLATRQLQRHRARSVLTLPDGVAGTFAGPAQCLSAARALIDTARSLGLHVKAGGHTGEIDRGGDVTTTIAFAVAAGAAANAGIDEVLVSRTVVDLVSGTGISCEDRGTHTLTDDANPWPLFAVV